MSFKTIILSALCCSLLPATSALAQSAEDKGMEIAIASDKRDNGWGSLRAQMEMILENRAGKTSTRKIESRQL
jgi:hypothetical protein